MSSDNTINSQFRQVPDDEGRFGIYGGRYVAETLIHALDELDRIYTELKDDPAFIAEMDSDLAHYVVDRRLCILLND